MRTLAASAAATLAAWGGATAAQEMNVLCPGDARCPLSITVPTLPPGSTSPADVSLDFSPHASREGVDDGRLEQQTYEATENGQTVQRLVTSNTPVPDPEPRRARRPR